MSTHCGVAVLTEEGYKTIYCHNDGYPKHMVPVLTKSYNSKELANKLVNCGDASYITDELEPTKPYHTFRTPEPGVSIFYHRDRGEPWRDNEPALYAQHDKKRLLSSFYYAYIFEDGRWSFYEDGKELAQ